MKKLKNGIKTGLIFIAFAGTLIFSSSVVLPKEIIVDSEVQYDFSRSCMEKAEYDRAVYEFERFIHFFPDDPRVVSARIQIGICHLKTRQFEKARKVFKDLSASGSKPSDSNKALLLTAESYLMQGLSSEAVYYLKQVLENQLQNDLRDAAFYRLGWAELKASRWRDAAETFNRVDQDSRFYDSAQDLMKKSQKGELLPLKKPVYAGTMAAIVPGLGHVYVSRYQDAAVSFLLNGVFIWATIEAFQQDHDVLGGVLGALELGWYSGNIYSAVNCTHKYNRKVRNDFLENLTDQFDLGLFADEKGRLGVAVQIRF